MSATAQDTFAQRLIRWQRRHGRHDLPWQNTRDPYPVWLSEIMLQQTQVTTVIPYYQRFLERFPDIATLAAAPAEAVMALWSGLGYYARARNLHACAKAVVEHHGGRFPHEPEVIAELPGIGRSTANAIAAFCFDARVPILDGNVKRLLCRHAGIEGFPGTPAVESQLWRHAESVLPRAEVATYIQAQMDLGTTICTRSRPRCDACPVAADCIALRDGRTAELPAARPRKTLPERAVTLLALRDGDRVLLLPRPPTGIWGGLFSLPEIADEQAAEVEAARLGCRIASSQRLAPIGHTFTHFRLTMQPLLCEAQQANMAGEHGARWLSAAELAQAPLPAPIRKLLAVLLDQPVV
jgi:A/G-specific adenine glycosylase